MGQVCKTRLKKASLPVGGGAQSCVSSRVSGLQEASLLPSELPATRARGSERMRYLRGRGEPWVPAPPPPGALRGRGTYTMSLGSSRVSGGGLMRT